MWFIPKIGALISLPRWWNLAPMHRFWLRLKLSLSCDGEFPSGGRRNQMMLFDPIDDIFWFRPDDLVQQLRWIEVVPRHRIHWALMILIPIEATVMRFGNFDCSDSFRLLMMSLRDWMMKSMIPTRMIRSDVSIWLFRWWDDRWWIQMWYRWFGFVIRCWFGASFR